MTHNQLLDEATPGERWLPCPDHPRYLVSSFGRVCGPSGKILTPRGHTNGYRRVSVCIGNGQTRDRYIHDLVLRTFRGPRPSDQHEADHRDDDRANNRLSNLRWLTLAANRARRKLPRGELNTSSRLRAYQVRAIKAELPRRGDTEIGRLWGVDRKTIADIRSGKTWSDVACQTNC